jgi:pimeloyl-ACP methyl ester carboxylesterase
LAPTNLEKTECRFPVPRSLEGKAYECFDLSVPENRAALPGNTIKVHVAVFRGKPGGTPVFELNGGPGGSSDAIAVGLALGLPSVAQGPGRLLEIGDYVLIDQRGTGRSLPLLHCAQRESEAQCGKRLSAKGIDLRGYVTKGNAEDLHALKLALGVPKVALHGISYGSRLALEMLRRHPEDLAGTIIDGVMPAHAPVLSEGDKNLDELLTRIFAACAADGACNAAYPDLEQAFVQAQKKLDETDVTIDGERYDFGAFWGEVSQRLYEDGFAAKVPGRIYDVVRLSPAALADKITEERAAEEAAYFAEHDALSNKALLGEVEARMTNDPTPEAADMATGMFTSVVCSDYAQYESLEQALKLEETVRPALRNRAAVEWIFEACAGWPKADKASDVFAPVLSPLPVLAVAGAFDPATPARWRDFAAEGLSQHQKLTMAAGAHGAVDACAMTAKLGFLAAPGGALDTSCGAAQKISFAVPATSFRGARSALRLGANVAVMPVAPQVLAARRQHPSLRVPSRLAAWPRR